MCPEPGQLVEGVLTVGRRFDRIAPEGDHARQSRPLTLFVVDDQDSSRGVFSLDIVFFLL